jgi:hypothetical protein
MARGFAATYGTATSDRIQTGLTTHATTRTYAIWTFQTAPLTDINASMFDKSNAGVQFERVQNSSDGSGTYQYKRQWSGALAVWTSPRPSPSSGAWVHIVFTYDGGSSSNAPAMYYNGISQTVSLLTAASGTISTNTDAYWIGNRGNGDRWWDGMLAEAAIWDRILSAGEIAALGKGYSPLFFPLSLVEYVPMIRDNISLKNAAPTITGALVQPHPPIIYSTSRTRIRWQQPSGTAKSYFNQFPKPLLRQPLSQGRLL